MAFEIGPECGYQVNKQHSVRRKGLVMWSRVTVNEVPAPLRSVRENPGIVIKWH